MKVIYSVFFLQFWLQKCARWCVVREASVNLVQRATKLRILRTYFMFSSREQSVFTLPAKVHGDGEVQAKWQKKVQMVHYSTI